MLLTVSQFCMEPQDKKDVITFVLYSLEWKDTKHYKQKQKETDLSYARAENLPFDLLYSTGVPPPKG